MARVTVLGMGAMGSRMAAVLLNAGHQVTVWNRDLSKARALVAVGATTAATPREAVWDAEFAISMLRDDDASREVWLDEAAGALFGLPAEAVAIESSTISVRWAKHLADRFSDRSYIEAPVSGTLPQVENSQLIYFVGGDATTVGRARPILDALGAGVHHVGGAGSGATVKLAVNTLMCSSLAMVAEIIGTFAAAGLHTECAIEALTSTPLSGPGLKAAGAAMVRGQLPVMFPMTLALKDLNYFKQLASELGSASPMGEAVQAVYAGAVAKGLGCENVSAIVNAYK